jgi:hypothetical protein
MKKRNTGTVPIHISGENIPPSEEGRHVDSVGMIEFICADAAYAIKITDPKGVPDPPILAAPGFNGLWPAHGKNNDHFKYLVVQVFPKKSRRKTRPRTHTIIIDGGSDSGKRRRKNAKKKGARRSHTIIVHS